MKELLLAEYNSAVDKPVECGDEAKHKLLPEKLSNMKKMITKTRYSGEEGTSKR